MVDYGIRGMHLAYDLLDPWDALVLVDALPDPGDARQRGRAGDRGRTHLGAGGPVDAHGMDPATVLANLAALGGRLPPRTLLVGCRVADDRRRDGAHAARSRRPSTTAVRTVQAVVAQLTASRAEVA